MFLPYKKSKVECCKFCKTPIVIGGITNNRYCPNDKCKKELLTSKDIILIEKP